MANWNLADGAGMLSLNVEAGDEGQFSGVVTYAGAPYSVSGAWAASGSMPGRQASAFSFSGRTPTEPPTFISASGIMTGPGAAPEQVELQGVVSSSADGGFTPFNVIALPGARQQPRLRGATNIYFNNWANDLRFRSRLTPATLSLQPVTITNATAAYLPGREVKVASIQRGGISSGVEFTAEIISTIASIPIVIAVKVVGTFADSTMTVSAQFGDQPSVEIAVDHAMLIKARTGTSGVQLGYKILAKRREVLIGHDDVVITLWPDSQDDNFNETLPSDWTKLQVIPLLDVGGEGRIASGANVTGFPMAYNLNATSQMISNGDNVHEKIPNKIPISDWANPVFPIDAGRVLFMTMMGVGQLNEKEVAEMMRCLDPTHGQILLYNLSPNDITLFDAHKASTLVLKRTVAISELGPPFSEIVGPYAPVRVYGWQGTLDRDEL